MDYKTTDIVLAACLKIQGYSLDSIEVSGRRGTFVFANVSEEFLSNFHCGKVLVDPVTFHGMLRRLASSVNRQLELVQPHEL